MSYVRSIHGDLINLATKDIHCLPNPEGDDHDYRVVAVELLRRLAATAK